jgi:hypothetical protein
MIKDVRTTLDIDDDVLAVAKDIAAASRSTAGKVLSQLARQGLSRPAGDQGGEVRNGVPLLAPRVGEAPVTSQVVNDLLDAD